MRKYSVHHEAPKSPGLNSSDQLLHNIAQGAPTQATVGASSDSDLSDFNS